MMIDAPVPPEILKLRDERGAIVPTDCMPLSHFNSKIFLNILSSHKLLRI